MGGRHDGLVIGLAGPIGSGVTTASRALEENDFKRYSLSEPIKAEWRKKNNVPDIQPLTEKAFPNFRKSLQDIGDEGRLESPSRWVDAALSSDLLESEIVIDGIRNLGEVNDLRRRFAKFFLIGLNAPRETRWGRVSELYEGNQRNFNRDDERDSDEDLPHGQQVGRCVLVADYVLVNDGANGSKASQKRFIYDQLKDDLNLMRSVDQPAAPGGATRPPFPDEAHMATAYAQSHISQCLKRHVGAVIVAENGLPMSLGYNENPVGMPPCHKAFGHCFKDDDMAQEVGHDGRCFLPVLRPQKCAARRSGIPLRRERVWTES